MSEIWNIGGIAEIYKGFDYFAATTKTQTLFCKVAKHKSKIRKILKQISEVEKNAPEELSLEIYDLVRIVEEFGGQIKVVSNPLYEGNHKIQVTALPRHRIRDCHEVAHYIVATEEEKKLINFGLGAYKKSLPAPHLSKKHRILKEEQAEIMTSLVFGKFGKELARSYTKIPTIDRLFEAIIGLIENEEQECVSNKPVTFVNKIYVMLLKIERLVENK